MQFNLPLQFFSKSQYYIMLQFGQEQQKGLFTFYREQQQFEQQLEREKKQLIRKKRQKREELKRQKIKPDTIIHQEQEEKINHEDHTILAKANTEQMIRKNKIDHSVVLIRSKYHKNKQQSTQKKPLSVLIFDPKIQKAPQFLIHKSEFGLMSSSIDKLHIQFKELFLSGLDQQLNRQINNSISQARQKRLKNKNKKNKSSKDQKSIQKEDFNKYKVALDSIAKGLHKDNSNSLKLPNLNKNTQIIKNSSKILINEEHKMLVRLNNSLPIQKLKNKRYSSNGSPENPNIAKIQGLLSLQKYRNSLTSSRQQAQLEYKPILNKARLQKSYN